MYVTLQASRRAMSGWRGFGRLRDVCSVDVNGNRVCGPPPLGVALPSTTSFLRRRVPITSPIARPQPVWGSNPEPVWGSNPPGWNWTTGAKPPGWQGGGTANWWNQQGNQNWWSQQNWQTPGSSTGQLSIAQLISMYQTNPSSLTPQQWSTLQAAGVIPSTLPYQSSSLVSTSGTTATASTNDPQCIAAGMTGGPYPNCTPAATASSGTDLSSAFSSPIGGLPLWMWLVIGGGVWFLFVRKGR